jgi:aromatic ring-opening dioxygenase LigB subunit
MPIVFSAITPHPPILIPPIGKDNLSRLDATNNSFEELRKILIKSRASTIIVISPHGLVQSDSFTMNLNPRFSCNFEDFGDFTTKCSWSGNIGLSYKIREKLETSIPLQLISDEFLDHGTSVPLYLLTKGLKEIKVIPLYYSGLDLESHFSFGVKLKSELQSSMENIAVVASGDLSHRLTKNAPAGFSPKGKKFDKKLIELITKIKYRDILDMDESLIIEAGECGLRSIMILLGILDGIKVNPKVLSYESPFGVGYLTLNFDF